MRALLAFFITLFCFSAPLMASPHMGGFSVGGTRVVYPAEKSEVIFSVSNSTNDTVYLVQSWVSSNITSSIKDKHFVVIPPLFRLNPAEDNQIRIIYAGSSALPTDRESLFWLNIKAIPGTPKNIPLKNTLQLAIKTELKLFYRPDHLSMAMDKAQRSLQWEWQSSKRQFRVTNPTPYYMTVFKASVGKKSISFSNNQMFIAPYSHKNFSYKEQIPIKFHDVTYYLIDDFGGNVSATVPLVK